MGSRKEIRDAGRQICIGREEEDKSLSIVAAVGDAVKLPQPNRLVLNPVGGSATPSITLRRSHKVITRIK